MGAPGRQASPVSTLCLLLPGVLLDIQQHFGVKDRGAGLLQSGPPSSSSVGSECGWSGGCLQGHRNLSGSRFKLWVLASSAGPREKAFSQHRERAHLPLGVEEDGVVESPNPEGLSRLPWAQVWPRLPLSGSGCFLSRHLASRWVVWAGGLSHETHVPHLPLSSPHAVFICSFMVAAPIFGYLGDRFNRKVILSCGIFFWSAVTFSSSFIPQQHFWLLVLSRGLVGIGEASYSTIAPTIIGDLFTKNTRTLMLSVFYFAIPLGSGLGYITGSSVKQAAGDWHWALRVQQRQRRLGPGVLTWCTLTHQVSPILGMITGTLILVLVPATKRGHADQLGGQLKARTSWLRDMKALIRNRSYVFSSLATSAVSFATGALGMWIPLYLHRAQVVQKAAETCSSPPCAAKDSLIFGAITCFTGFLGVVTGAGATRWCRLRTQRADPLVCAVGMLGSAIFICLIFVAAKSSIVGAYICIFVGETLLFSNWAITADILMYVVIPTRRATAVALQSFTSHLLGDAGSPYLIGFISDLIRQSTKDSPLWEFLSLGYALMLCPFVVVLGGMFFLATALFFLSDRAKAEQQ
ncbi:hypothetical protein J1605_008853 [Eschrichtius robustus]|uniref:Major facilitator superfamily (MFS) profile domain-containing protein n=1 Tax=Eschrichtius robustus TaxID=9764 RepID=A0AB34GZB0_ESCRO|nr:hypothetical protein J1605_008853 [Eschrichtius robustus]